MIKHSSTSLHNTMIKLFNMILKHEILPTNWALGIISPIFKKGIDDDKDNYRGITISSNLGKLFTRIMNKRLTSFLIENDL